MYSDVTLYAAFAFDPEGDNDCLTDREGGVFVWSERTGSLVARLSWLLSDVDIDDVIKDDVPMQQFIGPVNTGTS